MTSQGVKVPSSALHRTQCRLGGKLPIDVLATHYPDRTEHLLLNENLSRTPMRALRQDAPAPRDFLGQRLAQAFERSERERHRHLASHPESLLRQHTREGVLAWAANLLSRRPPSIAL